MFPLFSDESSVSCHGGAFVVSSSMHFRMKRVIFGSLGVLMCLNAPLSGNGAAVAGKVELPEPPKERRMSARYSANLEMEPLPPAPPVAVVYLEGTFADDEGPVPAEAPAPAVVQRGLRFFPALMPIRKGTRVVFPNEDNFYHNVFSYTTGNRFDLGRYRRGEEPPGHVFTEPGVVSLFCEIHGHMRGTILVLETPYFTVTDADGAFQLRGLPAGTFTLVAWLNENEHIRREVVLEEGETLLVNFSE
jgi:plastocyanin